MAERGKRSAQGATKSRRAEQGKGQGSTGLSRSIVQSHTGTGQRLATQAPNGRHQAVRVTSIRVTQTQKRAGNIA